MTLFGKRKDLKKILVLSDSHGDFDTVLKIYKKEAPQVVIFAGDGLKDAIELEYVYPETRFLMVRGNVDNDTPDGLYRLSEEVFGYRFFVTHGHNYNVKTTLNYLLIEAKKDRAEIAVYGHSHEPLYEQLEGVVLFNPGSVKNGDYGIIDIIEDNIYFHLKNIKRHKNIF